MLFQEKSYTRIEILLVPDIKVFKNYIVLKVWYFLQ